MTPSNSATSLLNSKVSSINGQEKENEYEVENDMVIAICCLN